MKVGRFWALFLKKNIIFSNFSIEKFKISLFFQRKNVLGAFGRFFFGARKVLGAFGRFFLTHLKIVKKTRKKVFKSKKNGFPSKHSIKITHFMKKNVKKDNFLYIFLYVFQGVKII